jgi:putative membrane-bound dehydrogenase-like protein
MTRAMLLVLTLAGGLHAQTGNAGRFTVPGAGDPFWPDTRSPKLVTPQWIGEDGVEAAVILAIDDMRDTAKYEAYLRPILDELRKDGGRAPVSIMTCEVKPDDPQLQAWLQEGLSIEVHTLKHPCPLLHDGNFQAAKDTVHGCTDLLWQIPHNQPVAFRTPCCDSMSTPSPRVFSEILAKATPQGHSLSIDSSVMCLITPKDKALPREIVFDGDGKERFAKYFVGKSAGKDVTPGRKSLANFGTYIEDYPYPYAVGGALWEFPCMVPSDWEAFNTHGANSPVTVADWKAALDAVVLKQGVFTFIFHPHGWIKAEQIIEFIRYTREKYGRRVKFLNFREAGERLKRNVPKERRSAAGQPEKTFDQPLPPDVTLKDPQGRDNGVRFVDLNADGYDDLVFSNTGRYGVYLFNPVEKKNVDWRIGWTFVMREGRAGDANSIPPIVRADGSDNGIWFKHDAMWVQNEDTSALPDKVRRIPFSELLKQPGPPARTPEESLKAIHLKRGFKAELVAQEPLVRDPIFIDWDAKGRMWVVEMGDYPFHEQDGKTRSGRIKILEDTDGDGIYDRATLFLDNLQYPTGLAPWKDGVFVASVPDVFFIEEHNGRPGKRTPILSGFTLGNPQHLVNGFCWGLDGWFYGGNGDSGGKVIEARSGREFDLNGRDYRFHPVTGEFQLQAGRTQYGRWRDDFGNWFGCNNSSMGWHYFLDERYLARNPKLAVPSLRRMLNNGPDNKRIFPVSAGVRRLNWPDAVNTLTSGCNAMPYRDTLFGGEYARSFFICEPANNLVHREVLEPDGISFRSHRAADDKDDEFLASEDNWSRFTMARTGPDGCLYVVDMYRQIIEHPEWIPKLMQEHIDLRAGEEKGRIYRIRPDPGKPRKFQRLDTMSEAGLVEALMSPNGWTRDTAQRLLKERQSTWNAGRGDDEAGSTPASRIQGLWTMRTLGTLRPSHTLLAMQDRDPSVRELGALLAEDALDDETVVGRLKELCGDESLRVRMQVALTLGGPCKFPAAVPDMLRGLAKRDGANPDMLTALLTSAPRYGDVLTEDAKAWQADLKALSKDRNAGRAPVQIITNNNPDRDKIVRQYVPAVAELKGDPARGHALYRNICAACHRLKNEGTEIGPDLGTVAGKPTEQIVEAIMDPSRAVEARYLAQTIRHKDGREFVAMIAEETANSLTLRTAAGTEVVLKGDVADRKTGTKSIMPEGVESLLTPQSVADVIAWIREK